MALPAGLWINASATVTGEHSGFPAYRLKVGRVTFPLAASRWIAELGRRVLRLNGVDIPPLDDLVSHYPDKLRNLMAELRLP